jgi:hypothetical protein
MLDQVEHMFLMLQSHSIRDLHLPMADDQVQVLAYDILSHIPHDHLLSQLLRLRYDQEWLHLPIRL